MSVNKVNNDGTLTTLASGQRVWIGSKTAHQSLVNSGKMPNNVLVINTDAYTNGGENYSTEEQKIGTWIDGKPLYRNVITVNNTEADFTSYHWVRTYATGFTTEMSFLFMAKYMSATMVKDMTTYYDGTHWGIQPFTFNDGRSTQYAAASGDRILIEYTKATD